MRRPERRRRPERFLRPARSRVRRLNRDPRFGPSRHWRRWPSSCRLAKGDRSELFGVSRQDGPRGFRRDAPEPSCHVIACGGQDLAVRRNGDGPGFDGVAGESVRPGRRIKPPDPRPRAVHEHQQPAVRRNLTSRPRLRPGNCVKGVRFSRATRTDRELSLSRGDNDVVFRADRRPLLG